MLVKTQPGFPDTPFVEMPLQNGMVTLVDPELYFILNAGHWYAKKSRGKWYACHKVIFRGKTHFLRMHRIVADTRRGMVCHHINDNSLDNRRANLRNMTWFEHSKYYSYR